MKKGAIGGTSGASVSFGWVLDGLIGAFAREQRVNQVPTNLIPMAARWQPFSTFLWALKASSVGRNCACRVRRLAARTSSQTDSTYE